MPGTVLEAILIGVARNIEQLEAADPGKVQEAVARFRLDESVSEEALKEGLSKKDKVNARTDAAIRIFAAAR